MKHPSQTVIKERKNWINHEGKEEFKQVLARSRFSLCPRGYAPNSIRFWESLQAGAIPLLISDTARLPEGFDWNRCCIRVAEKDIETIPDIIKTISPDQELKMREACFDAYKMFSGENFISPITRFYECETEITKSASQALSVPNMYLGFEIDKKYGTLFEMLLD